MIILCAVLTDMLWTCWRKCSFLILLRYLSHRASITLLFLVPKQSVDSTYEVLPPTAMDVIYCCFVFIFVRMPWILSGRMGMLCVKC